MDYKKLLGLLAKQSDEAAPAGQKLLNFGSQTAPEVLEQADEVIPEVLGKGTSKLSKAAGEIPDAEINVPKVSNFDALMSTIKENPKKIAGGLSLAELARQMSGGDTLPPSNDIPMLTPPQAKELDSSVVKESDIAPAVIPAPAKPLSDTDQARAGMDKFMANIPQDVPQAPAPEEGPNFLKMIEEANKQEKRDLLDAKWLRASELLGGGLARIAPEHGSSEITRKGAERHGEKAKAKIGAVKEQQSYDKAQSEVNDEKALRDPNSDISKQTVSQLSKYGINVKSAMEAKQLNPQIFNLLMADRAQKNAKEVAAMGLEVKKEKEGKELDNKQRKFARDLRKEATTGVLGKQYATFSTGQRMSSSLAEFAKNPSGYKDYATLMGGLKSLQGDESVVREAEMRLGINATSLINKAQNYLSAAATGKSLQPSQRKEMLDTINILTDASRKQYMQSVAPILEQAEMEGIPSSMILSGSLQGAADESDSLTTPPEAGGLVKVTRNEDGKSKMMTPEAAARADKTKFTIGK